MLTVRPVGRVSNILRFVSVALLGALALVLAGCWGTPDTPTPIPPAPTLAATDAEPPTATPLPPEPTETPAPPSTATPTPIPVSERGFVPVLCYHHVRNWVKSDTED